MKTFLQILFLLVVAVIAVKLLPFTLCLGILLGIGILGLAAVGVSVFAIFCALAVVIAAVLSPIWIPALVIVGVIALIRRYHRRTVTA